MKLFYLRLKVTWLRLRLAGLHYSRVLDIKEVDLEELTHVGAGDNL